MLGAFFCNCSSLVVSQPVNRASASFACRMFQDHGPKAEQVKSSSRRDEDGIRRSLLLHPSGWRLLATVSNLLVQVSIRLPSETKSVSSNMQLSARDTKSRCCSLLVMTLPSISSLDQATFACLAINLTCSRPAPFSRGMLFLDVPLYSNLNSWWFCMP